MDSSVVVDHPLVIVPDNATRERRRRRRVCHVLSGAVNTADVLVWTKSAFEARTYVKASLPGTVLREGRLLHAA